MYKEHFGFTKRPFENTPDPSFLFLSASHREILASLIYGINSAKGFILISGDVGTGKTTLMLQYIKEQIKDLKIKDWREAAKEWQLPNTNLQVKQLMERRIMTPI